MQQIDEHLAWELQHEEDLGHTSIESHHTSHPVTKPLSLSLSLGTGPKF